LSLLIHNCLVNCSLHRFSLSVSFHWILYINLEEYNRQIFFLLLRAMKEGERKKSNNVKIFDNNDSYVGAGPWWLYGGCTHAFDICWLKHVELFLKKVYCYLYSPSGTYYRRCNMQIGSNDSNLCLTIENNKLNQETMPVSFLDW
jgi:hypothetical protein